MALKETEMMREPMRLDVAGTGAPLLLVGGGLTGWRSWQPHAARWIGRRQVVRAQLISVDRGLDDRPLPPRYSVSTESDALAAALDTLESRSPLDAAAWSYGALVTLDLALAQPQRFRTLALIEPPALWLLDDAGRDDADLRALRELARALPPDIGEGELERFVRAVGLCPPDAAPRDLPSWPLWFQHRRSLRNLAAPFEHREDPARLRRLECPVLLVTGTGTAPFLRRIVDTLAARLPAARVLELPDGHAPHLVSQERFITELERFQLEAASPAQRNERA